MQDGRIQSKHKAEILISYISGWAVSVDLQVTNPFRVLKEKNFINL